MSLFRGPIGLKSTQARVGTTIADVDSQSGADVQQLGRDLDHFWELHSLKEDAKLRLTELLCLMNRIQATADVDLSPRELVY
jgi:hypothetical protein